MTENWIVPRAGTGCDRAAIQTAIDTAAAGCGNVWIPQGVWTLDGCLMLPESIHVHLDGAHLRRTAAEQKDPWIFCSSRAYDPFANNRVGNQRGIVISGENGAVLEGTCGIMLRNVSRFLLEGLTFARCSQYAVSLAFSYSGKLRNLRFRECLGGVECCAGTRDCLFEALGGDVEDALVLFDDERRREMGIYYYGTSWAEACYPEDLPLSRGFEIPNTLLKADGKGYPVTNHILRDVRPDGQGHPYRIKGTLCRNVLTV